LRRARSADPTARARLLYLVAGSQAADLDSLAASIAYAWLLRLELKRGPVLPYVPIARADLRLRPEALELFGQIGLDPSGLLFADELEPGELGLLAGLQLSLVDSDGSWLPQALQARIVEVLDHHAGADPSRFGAPGAARTVEQVGSTCTLVAERFLLRRPEAVDPALAVLLLGPILLDTAGLDPAAGRAAERDRIAAARLGELAGLAAGGLYARLLQARGDLSGLASEELLRRDFKEGWAGGVRYGISSVPISRERWLERDLQRDRALGLFREARALDLLLVMAGYQERGPASLPAGQPADSFRRELALCAGPPRLAARAEAFLRSLPLGLQEMPEAGPAVCWFRQAATEFSRKRLEPLLRAWLEGEGPDPEDSASPADTAGGAP